MSYLARLVERHFGEPAIQPRTRSRFESRQQGVDTDAAPIAPVATAAQVTQLTPGRKKSAAASVREQPRIRVERAAVRGTTKNAGPAPAATPGFRRAARREDSGCAERPPAQKALLETVAAPVVTLALHNSDQGSITPPRQRPHAEREAPVQVSAEPRRWPHTERTLRLKKEMPNPPASVSSPATPEVVRVHIGRIEVRAVPASSSSTPPPNRAALLRPLSLDGYLKGKA